MVRRKELGFTLIELILVMAISASLAMIAFVGQGQLRDQAYFDTSIDKIVATINDARNEAVAGVNILGSGDGSVAGCVAGVAGSTLFRGTSWSFANGGLTPITLDYFESTPNSGFACHFKSQTYGVTSQITASVLPGPVGVGGRILFVRTDAGNLEVCPFPGLGNPMASFAAGACVSGTITFQFVDTSGRTSRVSVDGSGIAKRLN